MPKQYTKAQVDNFEKISHAKKLAKDKASGTDPLDAARKHLIAKRFKYTKGK